MSAKKTDGLGAREAIEEVVLNLINAKPEHRAVEATSILGYMTAPSMGGYAWDELCRSRKNKPLPGLTIITEMLDSQGKKHLRSGQDPSLQILSIACTKKEWIQVLLASKQKKVIQGVFAVLGDRGTSLKCKENAAWILRRATEFSDTAKTLVAGSRDNLVIMAKMLNGNNGSRSQPSSPTIEVIDSPDGENEEAKDNEIRPMRRESHASPVEDTPGQPACDVEQTPPAVERAPSGQIEDASPVASRDSILRVTSPTVSPERQEGTEWMARDTDFSMTLTGMSNTGVAFAADANAERCAIQGNCCIALAQSALRDEVLERLGGTKEILCGLVCVLTTGTEWAAGSAARAIANIAYRPENLTSFMTLLDEEKQDQLIGGVARLAKSGMRAQSKEYSVLCMANMLAHDGFLTGFARMQDLKVDLAILQKSPEPAISTEATRAVTLMNQARFGTISWRAPKRV